MIFENEEAIYSYTRQQAIEDGVLIDVSNLAKEAGFRFPVAFTRAVWSYNVEVPEGVTGQDETGRLGIFCRSSAGPSKKHGPLKALSFSSSGA